MKRLLCGLMLGASGFLVSQAVNAACSNVGLPASVVYQTSGAGVQVSANIYDTVCSEYTTTTTGLASDSFSAYSDGPVRNHAVYGGPTDVPVIRSTSAKANRSGLTTSVQSYAFNTAYGSSMYGVRAYALAKDQFTFVVPAGHTATVPFRVCSNYKSDGEHYYGEYAVSQFYVSGYGAWPSWDDPSTGAYGISHRSDETGRVCHSGKINYYGAGTYTLSAQVWSSVVGGITYEPFYVYSLGGSVNASFTIGDAKLSCSSAGGDAPGCERQAEPEKDKVTENPCAGNPINLAGGFKYQVEPDYSGGALSFSRIYRSDSTWTHNTVGELWRHNFARTLNVSNKYADITDESGGTTYYTLSGGVWVAQDKDVTAKLESITGGYVYTLPNDTREIYDSNKKLVRIEYRGGGSLDFGYDGNGLLETVSDENGREIEISYSSGRVSSIDTPDGVYSYSYDGAGNLVEVEKPDSTTREYHYEDTNFPNALTGITDENNVRFATYAYDAQGRAISTQHAGGADNYDVAYNSDGSVTTTNPLGKETTYHFNTIQGARRLVSVEGHASASCAAANKAYTYDANGWLSSKTDWAGNVTSYTRNAKGLVTGVTESDGSAEERTTTTTYITGFNLPDVITEDGKTTDYDYDGFGRVTSVTVTDTATSESRTTSYTYYSNTTDANGNTVLGKLHTVNGARTDVSDITTYSYDSQGRLINITNAASHETDYLSFDAAHRPLTFTDGNGVLTTLVYDAVGRLTSSTKSGATWSYAYDAVGNLESVTSPDGVTLVYAYDNARRLVGIEDELGNTITYTLDAAGNITNEVYKDSGNTLRYSHTRAYDELSRLITDIDGNSDETAYLYDVNDNLTSVTDGNLNATTYAYDGLNRLISQTDALSGITSYGLNALDQTESVTDPRSVATTYTYNAFGDVLTETSADRGTITYTYDSAGNIASRTDGKGQVISYSYDVLNRITAVAYTGASALNESYSYDACTNGIGKICSVTDASGTAAYAYDALGNLASVSETRGALNFTTSYSFNGAGRLTQITYPSGRVVAYGYDAAGNISSVTADSQSIAGSITYMPFGGVSSLTFGNSVVLTNSYNTAYQLTNKQHGGLSNTAYTYDAAGNITAKGATSYGYDALYRLLNEDIFTYTYDAIGNRLTDSANSYSYTSGSSILSAVNANAITTDAGGYITATTGHSYTWDAAGRLASVSDSGGTLATYTYDANNQRTSKTTASGTVHYVHGAGGLLYGEYDASGALIREYIYLHGQPLAQIDAGAPETITYLHTDHLGTPRKGSNQSGLSVWSWDSDAFGVGNPTGSRAVNLRMAGQYADDESGLFYNWNRYYNPSTGRYISSDPIGLAGGLNTFAYVSANPVMFVDPEGKMLIVPWIIGAGSFLQGFSVGVGVASAVDWWQGDISNQEAAVNIAASAACYGAGGLAVKYGKSLLPSSMDFLGGKYGHIKGKIPGNEAHHMPPKSVTPESTHNGPAVSIPKEMHKETASYGFGAEAAAYRKKLKEMIDAGDYSGAQQMDINDLLSICKRTQGCDMKKLIRAIDDMRRANPHL